MGAELTKLLVDSKVNQVKEKLSWNEGDDGDKKGQEEEGYLPDELINRANEFFGQVEEEVLEGTSIQGLSTPTTIP